MHQPEKQEDAKNLKECINAIAYDFPTELTAQKAMGKRVKKWFLSELIKEIGRVCCVSFNPRENHP